jgi:hypothetical protein
MTDYMIHASVALIVIAHVLFGGDLLSVWGGAQEQVTPLFEAARAVTMLVPLNKVRYDYDIWYLYSPSLI